MANDGEKNAKAGDPQPKSALSGLGVDAGCVVMFIPLVITGAAVQIFNTSLGSGNAWAGAAAVAALAVMGVGVVYVLTKVRE